MIDQPKPRPTLRLKPPAPPSPARPARRKPFRVAGWPAVAALFAQDPDRVERLYFDERFRADTGPFCARLAEQRKPYRMVPAAELEKIAGSAMHGGIVAEAQPRPVLAYDPAMARQWRAEGRRLLILDGVSNPHNLGAIIRTAAFFGIDRVLISDHKGQALPSEAAYRVAEGGFEYVDLYQAQGFAAALAGLRPHYRTVGTALGDFPGLDALSPSADGRPTAFVMGNEEHGMPPESQSACEALVTIRGSGWVQSLNVSATTAILAFLLAR